MKRILSILLLMVFTFCLATNGMAYDVYSGDFAVYYDKEKDECVRIERANVYQEQIDAFDLSDSACATKVYSNNFLYETIFVDFTTDQIIHVYQDDKTVIQKLSDVVTIKQVDDPYYIIDKDESDNQNRIIEYRETDYINNEPLYVTSSGIQAELTGAAAYSGYRAMGYRTEYGSGLSGYLQRRNEGVINTYYSHVFTFDAGTTIGTGASVICTFFTSRGISILLGLVTSILGAIIDTVTFDWSTKFEVKQYQWLYRVRLGSNTGSIIYTTYRTQDYWIGYNPATGAVSYNYRGSAYDTGFALSNPEMINTAIYAYLGV